MPIPDRAERIAQVAYDYGTQPKQETRRCNLCGHERLDTVSERDRYGYIARSQGCLQCGLVFLNPVMTPESYGRFYAGVYRPLVSAYHGRLIDAQTLQKEQKEYAMERAEELAPLMPQRPGATLLDIGGSTGVIAKYWSRRFGLRGAVLDPSPEELEHARSRGLETIAGLLESFDPGPRRFDVVSLCQTVDHLLDVAGAMRKIRALLSEDGIFYVDIVDFRVVYRRHRSVKEAIKIDHPFYLVEETMEAYLERAGFTIVQKRYAADHLHLGFICRGSTPRPEALPSPEQVAALWKEIRQFQDPAAPVREKPLKVLGVIPARAGSKGIPGKNKRLLAGRPLIEYAFRAARDSGVVERIVLSTDSEEVAEVGRQCGIEVPFLRPKELATDEAPMTPVVMHAVSEMERQGWKPEAIMLLQPTAPLRRAHHLVEAVRILQRTGCDSVASVAKLPLHVSPDCLLRLQEGRLEPFLDGASRATRRQDARAGYVREGTVYLVRRDILMEQQSLYGHDCRPLVLAPEETLALDEPEDWEEAERRMAGIQLDL